MILLDIFLKIFATVLGFAVILERPNEKVTRGEQEIKRDTDKRA